jgi:CheY-like chemotaxis protein
MKPRLNCVLVIDDDEPTNYFNRMILESRGCAEHVKAVQTGKEALEYLTTAANEPYAGAGAYPCPDLILLDINMPAMDGWEFLERYRKLDEVQRGKIVIVMLTTSLYPDDITRARSIPEISAFENKPLTMDKLNKILQRHFEIQEVAD